MSKLIKVATILSVTLFLAGTAHAKELFKATLSGDQEVPPVSTQTSGKAFLRANNAKTKIEFQLHLRKGVGITQAHIHCAPAGQNGAVVAFLAGMHAAGLDINGKWISKATLTDGSIVNAACGATISELVDSMRAGNTYINVHSIANPAGEVRGQIKRTRKK